jgi:L-alanine-DL-glutamate epimerase-like enolase superfamily enzyme
VRAAVGSDLDIMIDANQGWRMPWDITPSWTLKEALGLARALAPLNVRWLEEPLHRDDHDGMRTLRQQADIRIAGAELAREMGALHRLIDARCLDVLQPDAVCVGGITGLVEIASAARARGIAFTPHTWGNGIGQMANLHLTAGCSNAAFLEFPYDPPEWTVERRDYPMANPVRIDKEGWLVLSDAPGLGVELDEALLARTRM